MTQLAQPSIPILDLNDEINEMWDELNSAIQRVLRSGQFVGGPDVTAFEHEAASYLGVKHAVGLNSGTDALIIGLRALGIGPGDEVITSPFSFFATAESISNVGAKPIFVDIEASSFNLDPNLIEAAITPKTKAIMPVHLYGQPASMTKIMEIAQTYHLKVIEDCAQSFGARYLRCEICKQACSHDLRETLLGRFTGSLGDIGAFSFYPTKNLGAYGDAGLLSTNSNELAEKARMLRSHGSKKRYHHEVLGYNSRLDSLQAAILRVKLPYIDTWNHQRQQAAQRYNDSLKDLPRVITPTVHEAHIFHQYTIRLVDADRDKVQESLQKLGISTMVYYPIPQHLLPVYKGQYPSYPVSEMLAKQVISLPIWPSISQEVQSYVVEGLARVLAA